MHNAEIEPKGRFAKGSYNFVMAMTIALLPEGTSSRERYLSNLTLPLNYMEDFSLMVFIVDRYPEAYDVLTSKGYSLQRSQSGIELTIARPEQIREIDSLLRSANIQTLFTVIADTIYQA